MDTDTPLYKGVRCPQPASASGERSRNESQHPQPQPRKSNHAKESYLVNRYRCCWPIVAKMPPLSNWPDRSLSFDYGRSDVIQFIMQRCGIDPAAAVGIFHLAMGLGVIVFDAASKTWVGVKGGH